MEKNELAKKWDSPFVKSLKETKQVLLDYRDILESETMEPEGTKIISCESCKKTYKTNTGYERHIRNIHTSTSISTITPISDHTIVNILKDSLSELGSDLCYPITVRSKWSTYQITENEELNAKVKKIYGKLVISSNGERFYEEFYSQILTSPSYFPGLEYQHCVELLRKSADKILSHFVQSSRPSPQIMESIMTSHEIDALEYLGGYVLHNIEKKLIRKKDVSSLAILDCFESDCVTEQPLVNLLNRGGLTGINAQAKIIFTKAEKVFRNFVTTNGQKNIDCRSMVDNLLTDVEVMSCCNTATQLLDPKDEEELLNVAEKMLHLYLRVRSFSHVRDLASQKMKEKKIQGKDKALRKTLKKNEN